MSSPPIQGLIDDMALGNSAEEDVLTIVSTLRTTFSTSTFTLDTAAVMDSSRGSSTTDALDQNATASPSELLPWLFPATFTVIGSQSISGSYELFTSTLYPASTASAAAPNPNYNPTIPVIITQAGLSDLYPTQTLVSESLDASTLPLSPDATRTTASTIIIVNPTHSQSPEQSPGQSAQANAQPNILTPILAAVIPFFVLSVCLILYLWWRHRKNLRQKEEDNLERDVVWVNHRNQNNDGDGVTSVPDQSNNPGRSVRTRFVDATRSAILPLRSTKAVSTLGEGSQARSIAVPESMNDDQDPFASPTSESSFVRNYLDNSPPRKSQIGLAVTTPSDHDDLEREIPESSSTQTIIHHTSESGSNPFNDGTSEHENTSESYSSTGSDGDTINKDPGKHFVTPPTYDGAESSPLSYRAGQGLSTISERTERREVEAHSDKSSMSSFQSFEAEPAPHSSGTNKNRPSIELARACILSLKREARDAQIAAAEAERQANRLRPADSGLD